MDLNKIKAKLAEHNAAKQAQSTGTGGGGDNLFWKPKPGTQHIRVIPNPHNTDDAGVELHFYYEFGKPMLAPMSFNDPDPVVDFCKKLKSEKGDKPTVSQNWKIANKLSPKKRVFVPIIVRGVDGAADSGPFWWGMAPSYYIELLKIIADPDYGDISDFERGRDLTVEFVPAVKEGAFPETFIRPRGNPSITTEDTVLFDKLKSLKNIIEVYKLPTVEELREALKSYLTNAPAPEAKEEPAAPEVTAAVEEFADEFDLVFKKGDEEEPKTDDLPF